MGDAGTFGPYRLEALLGRGGMGTVHRAFDTRRERTVALKRLDERLAADEEYRARFRRECRLAARLSSPHVVPIHDFGEVDGVLYLDMRLIDGRSLDDVLADGPLDPERAVRTVEQVGHALDAAHAAGLVHRDVKPSNVLVGEPDGFVHLADFGIARPLDPDARSVLTGTGAAPGTPAYLAPESLTGAAVDHRVDVYALACVLYETLTGRRPFDGAVAQLVHHHLHTPPPDPVERRPGLPRGLTGVVRDGMAKDPAQRPGSAGELGRRARAALEVPTGVRSPGERSPGGRTIPVGNGRLPHTDGTVGGRTGPDRPEAHRSGRRAVVVAGAVVLAVVVAGTAGVLLAGADDARPDSTDVRLAFPEARAVGCATGQSPVTSAGRSAEAAVACERPATAARAEFVEWATAADALLAVRDAGSGRSSLESEWKIQLVPQGPVFFGDDGGGGWVAVGAYRDRRFGFVVRAPSREQLSATFREMIFVPADQLPS